jgi:hypothetical protein
VTNLSCVLELDFESMLRIAASQKPFSATC